MACLLPASAAQPGYRLEAAVDDAVPDDLDQVVEVSKGVKDRARRVQDRAARAQRQAEHPTQPGLERHERSDRAVEARARADHDRGLLDQARAELAEDDQESWL
jgi:hypothetical protein